MNKDVVYIDVEDDITAIVGKIKASKEKIVALVPPSRVGVLQSGVSMRLLDRSAKQAGKRIVLISNNQALTALAAVAKIPVARNLQSKPELVDVPAVLKVDGDDVIDGDTLPVGELARATKAKSDDAVVDAVIHAAPAVSGATRNAKTKTAKKAGSKVPDFSKFRKKIFLIGGAAVLLIAFLVWAIWFAPRATVIITAKTTTVTVDENVTLAVDGATSVEKNTIKTLRQEQKSDLSVEFTATGKKNVGNKATGQVRFTNSSPNSVTIAAGTVLQNSGLSFVLGSSVTVPAATLDFNCSGYLCAGKATGTVNAAEGGSQYNGATGSLSGVSGSVSAAFTAATSGGTDKTATVVSKDDLEEAAEQLAEKKDDTLRAKLKENAGSSVSVIEDSYKEQRSDPTPSVAVDAEATGPVTLKSTITASILAVDTAEIKGFLTDSIKKEIDGMKSQKIYETGAEKVKFAQFTQNGDTATVRLTANGSVGPTIDEAQVKEQARGKSYGDIQSSLETIDGIESVDTKFSPFWVRTIPDKPERITVEFKLQNAS